MKDLLSGIKTRLRRKEQEVLFDNFISNYISREERHYCAYLFSWLIKDPEAIKSFMAGYSKTAKAETSHFSKLDIFEARVYYEYTAIRELLDLAERKMDISSKKAYKKELKTLIEQVVFFNSKGHVQMKKPDLVFHFPKSGILVLVEAKFEGSFDELQMEQTKKYGEALREMFPGDIQHVYVTALGLQYYVKKIENKYPVISWESLIGIIQDENIRNEIKKGLNYQKLIHPRAMADWEAA